MCNSPNTIVLQVWKTLLIQKFGASLNIWSGPFHSCYEDGCLIFIYPSFYPVGGLISALTGTSRQGGCIFFHYFCGDFQNSLPTKSKSVAPSPKFFWAFVFKNSSKVGVDRVLLHFQNRLKSNDITNNSHKNNHCPATFSFLFFLP